MTKSCEGTGAINEDRLVSRRPIRIGCAGWNFPRENTGDIALGGSHLQRYSQVFNCCEINSSFYRPHKPQTWERWANSVPAEFRFSVKAPRTITHESRLNCSSKILLAFLQQTSYLWDKLGPLLFQLPPSLKFDYAPARSFLALLRDNYAGDVIWEPRHGSWFEDGADDLLKHFRIARAASDPACVPAAANPGGLGALAYFRLHGSPRIYYSAYTADFLSVLASTLENLGTSVSAWCIFDNTASGYAIQNALELSAKVQRPESSLVS